MHSRLTRNVSRLSSLCRQMSVLSLVSFHKNNALANDLSKKRIVSKISIETGITVNWREINGEINLIDLSGRIPRNLKSNRPRLICLSIRNCLLRGASRAGVPSGRWSIGRVGRVESLLADSLPEFPDCGAGYRAGRANTGYA